MLSVDGAVEVDGHQYSKGGAYVIANPPTKVELALHNRAVMDNAVGNIEV